MSSRDNSAETGRAGGHYRDLAYFWKYVRPLWLVGLTSLLLTAISTALSSLLPLSVKLLIDFIVLKKPVQEIGVFLTDHHLGIFADPVMQLAASLRLMIITILIVSVVIGIIGIIEKVITIRFQQRLTFSLQTSLFSHVLRYPLSIIKQKQVGYLMSRVSDDVGMIQFCFSFLVPQLATNFFYSLFGFIILFSLDRTVGGVLLFLVPVLVVLNYGFSSRIRAIRHREMEGQAKVSKEMHEVLSGAEVVKAFTAENRAVERVSGKLRQLFSTRQRTTLLNAFSGALTRQAQLGILLVVVVLGIERIEAGRMSIGDFTTVMAYIVYLSGRVSGISSSFLSLQPVFASMGRLREMFGMMPEYERTIDGGERELFRPDKIRGEIVFSDVTFSYETDKPVFDSVSFSVNPGQTLVITGKSGAGKTTLINLLLKFHAPDSGRILLDGRDIREVDTGWLREQIGVVSQDVFLFNDTVENNIRFGRPGAGMDEVLNAAKQARIHDHIETLPLGYLTMMGERGVSFSLGQRQRISIARAFLKDPAILILDEPSSALDVETELQLKESLVELSKDRTTLLISHRKGLIEGLDGDLLEL